MLQQNFLFLARTHWIIEKNMATKHSAIFSYWEIADRLFCETKVPIGNSLPVDFFHWRFKGLRTDSEKTHLYFILDALINLLDATSTYFISSKFQSCQWRVKLSQHRAQRVLNEKCSRRFGQLKEDYLDASGVWHKFNGTDVAAM